MVKAFAVISSKLPRSNPYSPLSTNWTLYNYKDLAKELNIDEQTTHQALEKTGFNKAARS
jgi:hypothetical protein